MNGLQPISTSLIKRITARDTVAGVAFFRELISKSILMAGESGSLIFQDNLSLVIQKFIRVP